MSGLICKSVRGFADRFWPKAGGEVV